MTTDEIVTSFGGFKCNCRRVGVVAVFEFGPVCVVSKTLNVDALSRNQTNKPLNTS